MFFWFYDSKPHPAILARAVKRRRNSGRIAGNAGVESVVGDFVGVVVVIVTVVIVVVEFVRKTACIRYFVFSIAFTSVRLSCGLCDVSDVELGKRLDKGLVTFGTGLRLSWDEELSTRLGERMMGRRKGCVRNWLTGLIMLSKLLSHRISEDLD